MVSAHLDLQILSKSAYAGAAAGSLRNNRSWIQHFKVQNYSGRYYDVLTKHTVDSRFYEL